MKVEIHVSVELTGDAVVVDVVHAGTVIGQLRLPATPNAARETLRERREALAGVILASIDRAVKDGYKAETVSQCEGRSPMGNRCDKPMGHPGPCHANDGRYVEDWSNTSQEFGDGRGRNDGFDLDEIERKT